MGEEREPVGISVLPRGDAEYFGSGFRDYAPVSSRRIPVGWRRYLQDDWFALNSVAGKTGDRAAVTAGTEINGEIRGGRR